MSRLPAEFEKQVATVLLFPSRDDVWREGCKPIRHMMVALANAIVPYERVVMGVLPELKEVVKEYPLDPRVEILEVKYNDCWSRDTVSSVVYNDDGSRHLASFGFNSYGAGLYEPWDDDEAIDETVSAYFNYGLVPSPIILEGGNIAPDGRGTLFAIRESIVNDNRNPGLSTEEVEARLKEATASEQIVWIEKGLPEDETGGHIDNVLFFVDHETLLLSWTDDEKNAHYARVREIEETVKAARNVEGKPYKIIHIPVPDLYFRTADDSDTIVAADGSFERKAGDAVLQTYINFAIANGVVVVPQFGLATDAEAIKVVKAAFPDRVIVPFDAKEASLGGGGLHCLSKHIH